MCFAPATKNPPPLKGNIYLPSSFTELPYWIVLFQCSLPSELIPKIEISLSDVFGSLLCPTIIYFGSWIVVLIMYWALSLGPSP